MQYFFCIIIKYKFFIKNIILKRLIEYKYKSLQKIFLTRKKWVDLKFAACKVKNDIFNIHIFYYYY